MVSEAGRNGRPLGCEDILAYPHSARLWNLAAGGKDCFRAERDLFDRIGEAVPHPAFSQLVHANNAFVQRVLAKLHALGITQFIDLGPGLPVDPSTSPGSKVVYVDNDVIVLAHTRALRDQPGPIEEIADIMACYVDHLPPGSYTAISHFHDPDGSLRPLEGLCRFRTRNEIEALFPGQHIEAPGIVPCCQWRNPGSDATHDGTGIAGGLGRVRKARGA